MFLVYMVKIPHWYMISEEIWNWYESFFCSTDNILHNTRSVFFFANLSILEIIQNIEAQFDQKPIYFIHHTWPKTIAEIPTDIILITVGYKYANYITFQIWFRLLNSRLWLPFFWMTYKNHPPYLLLWKSSVSRQNLKPERWTSRI